MFDEKTGSHVPEGLSRLILVTKNCLIIEIKQRISSARLNIADDVFSISFAMRKNFRNFLPILRPFHGN